MGALQKFLVMGTVKKENPPKYPGKFTNYEIKEPSNLKCTVGYKVDIDFCFNFSIFQSNGRRGEKYNTLSTILHLFLAVFVVTSNHLSDVCLYE